MSELGSDLDGIISSLRDAVKTAEEHAAARLAELEAARRRVNSLRDEHASAEGEAKRLRRSLAALAAPLHGRTGRPRGTGDPNKTRLRVAELLPSRTEWTPSQIRAALAADGHEVSTSAVGAALVRLREDGVAVNPRRGVWAPPSLVDERERGGDA